MAFFVMAYNNAWSKQINKRLANGLDEYAFIQIVPLMKKVN